MEKRQRATRPVIEATAATYDALVHQPGYTLVMYDVRHAEYRCKPRILTAFRRMGRRYGGKLRAVYVDVSKELVNETLGFIPTFRVFVDGTYFDGVEGYANGKWLEQWITSLMESQQEEGNRGPG